jgi:hypothetical protein
MTSSHSKKNNKYGLNYHMGEFVGKNTSIHRWIHAGDFVWNSDPFSGNG